MQCTRFSLQRATLLQSINVIDPNIMNFPMQNLAHILLFGHDDFNEVKNINIFIQTIAYIKATKRFDKLEAFDDN